jgi:CheY-like chemotaxis protein
MAILLVEDDADIRADLAELLRDDGFEVVTAQNGEEALTRLRQGLTPTVILLDLMMPVMDGWKFRSEQLRDPTLARIPTVLLSGAYDVRQQARDLRASAYVPKPLEWHRLRAILDAVA